MAGRKKDPKTVTAAAEALRAAAAAYPETTIDFPWGETAVKVKGKVFLFMYVGDGGLSCSMKLPASREDALALPFTEPTHYGLGKSGWVTSKFAADEEPPLAILLEWLDESFRAIAPKTVVARLDGVAKPRATAAAPAKKKAK